MTASIAVLFMTVATALSAPASNGCQLVADPFARADRSLVTPLAVGEAVTFHCRLGYATSAGQFHWGQSCGADGQLSPRDPCQVGVGPANAERVGHGVHALFASVDGDPTCENASCGPPAFSQSPVFNMSSYAQGRSFDNLLVPDGWTYKAARKCEFDSMIQEIHSWADYDSTVNAFTQDKHRGLFHSSTRSSWFQAIVRATGENRNVLVRKSAFCSSYMLSRDIFAALPQLSAEFRQAVAQLPASYDPAHPDVGQQAQFNFVQAFGTDIVEKARFGGKAVFMSEFEATSFSLLKQQQGDLSSSATLDMLCKMGDQTLCKPGNPNWAARQQYASVQAATHVSYIPQPVVDPALGFGGAAWAQQAQDDPDVIEFTLQPITVLLNELFFPQDALIAQRRLLLETFVAQTYCTMLEGGCGSMPSEVARWIRSPRLDLPVPRTAMATAAVSGNGQNEAVYYSLGGIDSQGNAANNTPFKFDTAVNQWTYMASPVIANPSTDGLVFARALNLGSQVIMTGGALGTTATPWVTMFDPTRSSWVNMEQLRQARYGHCAAQVGNQLVVIGGIGIDGVVLSSVEVFDPVENAWVLRTPMATPRAWFGCSVYNDSIIHLVGGTGSTSDILTDVQMYDVARDIWITDNLPPPMLPVDIPRYNHVQVTVGNQLFVIGGQNSSVSALSDVRILLLDQNTWLEGCPLIVPVMSATGFVVANSSAFLPDATEIHLVGGSLSTNPADITAAHQIFVMPVNSTANCATSKTMIKEAATALKAAAPGPRFLSHREVRAHWQHVAHPAAAAAARRRQRLHGNGALPVHPASSFLGAGISTITGELTAASVFDPLCETCFIGNVSINGLALPDAVSANNLQACSYHTLSTMIADTADASLQASAAFNLATQFNIPFLFDFSFSASAEAQAQASSVFSYQNVLLETTAQCAGFQLGYGGLSFATTNSSITATTARNIPAIPTLTPDFVQAISTAPSVFDIENPEPFLSVLQHFGDHVAVGLLHGARATQRFRLTQTDFSATLAAHVDVNYLAAHSFLFFWGSLHTEGAEADVKADANLQKYVSTNSTTCEPLCPPNVLNGTINSTEWYQTVGPTVDGQGAPVSYSMVPMTAFIDPIFFPNVSATHLRTVRGILEDLLRNGTYCQSIPGCAPAQHAPRWTASLPCPVTGCVTGTAAVIYNNSLYLVGGRGPGRDSFVSIDLPVANPTATPVWRYHPPPPSLQTSGSGLVVNDSLWILGGLTVGTEKSTASPAVDVFTFATSIWTSQAPLPVVNMYLTQPPVVLLHSSVMAFGSNAAGDSCQSYELQPGAPTWSAGAVHYMPDGCLAGGAALLMGQQVLLFGGSRLDGTCSSSITAYDPQTDLYRQVLTLPRPECQPRVFLLTSTQALVVSEQGRVFKLSLVNMDFTVLEDAPAAPIDTSSITYARALDRLYLLANGTVFAMEHVTNLQFDPILEQSETTQRRGPTTAKTALPKMNHPAVERRAAAHKVVSVRPQPPHSNDKPVKRFPVIGPLLHGYHLLQGDPLSSSGVDEGWRLDSIFQIPDSNDAAWENTMSVPDDPYDWLLPTGVDGQGYSGSDSCHYFEQGFSWSDTWHYQNQMQQYYPLAAEKYWWPQLLGAEFSAGGTFQKIKSGWSQLEADVLVALGRCKRYTLSFGATGQGAPFDFTSQFMADLRALPTTNQSAANDTLYYDFVQRYGLTVPKSIDLGAVVGRFSLMASATRRDLLAESFDLEGGMQANLLFLFGLRAEAGGAISVEVDNTFRAQLLDNYTICIPTCPPPDPNNALTAAAWQASLVNEDVTVQPIGAIFTTLADMVDQSQGRLPSDLQGAPLAARLEGLTQFIATRLCGLVPNCMLAEADPHWAQGDPATVPTAVAFATAFATANEILVVGGETSSSSNGEESVTNTVQYYKNGAWVTSYNLNVARSRAAGVQLANGDIWVCGGWNTSSAALASCEVWRGQSWIVAPALNTSRRLLSMALLNNCLYVFGGEGVDDANVGSIEMLNMSLPTAMQAWSLINNSLPTPLSGMAAIYVPRLNQVLLAGGILQTSSSSTFSDELYLFGSGMVTSLTLRLPTQRSQMQGIVLGNITTSQRVLLFGGYEQDAAGNPIGSSTSLIIDLTALTIEYGPMSPWQLAGVAATEVSADLLLKYAPGSPPPAARRIMVASGLLAPAGGPAAPMPCSNVTYLELSGQGTED